MSLSKNTVLFVTLPRINRTVFLDKGKTIDNVHNHSICTSVLSSQTFAAYLIAD